MAAARVPLTSQQFHNAIREAFGAGHEVRRAERLRGGTRKGVYRLTLDNDTTYAAYVWRSDENYWPADRPASGQRLTQLNGIDLFETAHRELSGCGAPVPEIILLHRADPATGGDVALVKDIRGGSLATLLDTDPRRAGQVVDRLTATVTAMHQHRRPWPGPPGTSRPAVTVQAVPRTILDQPLVDLAEAATRVARIAAVEEQLAETLQKRFAELTARRDFGLIHGELGPEHVLLDDADRPVLIDIEDISFRDIEQEHAFLEMRYGDHYPRLANGALAVLDDDRLRFYRLALYLSCIAGPLRLLDGDFPDRAGMLSIVEQNIDRALTQLDW